MAATREPLSRRCWRLTVALAFLPLSSPTGASRAISPRRSQRSSALSSPPCVPRHHRQTSPIHGIGATTASSLRKPERARTRKAEYVMHLSPGDESRKEVLWKPQPYG